MIYLGVSMTRLISVKVFPEASDDAVIQEKKRYKVYVREVARQGAANKGVLRVLARHFVLPQGSLRIVRGHTSQNKIVEIPDNTVLE